MPLQQLLHCSQNCSLCGAGRLHLDAFLVRQGGAETPQHLALHILQVGSWNPQHLLEVCPPHASLSVWHHTAVKHQTYVANAYTCLPACYAGQSLLWR